MVISMNRMAKRVSEREGLKKQVSIAQIAEVIKHFTILLAKEEGSDVVVLLNRYAKKK